MILDYNLPAADYHSAPGVSCSMLRNMDPPARLPVYLKEKHEPTPWSILGTLVHHRVLEPDAKLPEIAIIPEKYPAVDGDKPWNGNAKYCKDWLAREREAGRIPLKQAEYDTVADCILSVRANPLAARILSKGRSEASLFLDVLDLKNRLVLTKSRYDFIPDDCDTLPDLKTVRVGGGSPEQWSKEIANHGYHIQAAAYLMRWNFAFPDKPRTKWAWIVVEKEAPFLVSTYLASDAMIQKGWTEYLTKLTEYQDCVESGVWPGYAQRWETVELPRWMV